MAKTSRNANLKKARSRRAKTGKVFEELKTGERDLCAVIQDPPTELKNVDLYDVLRRGKGFRKARAKTVCLTAQVWPHDTLVQLSPAERARVVDCIKKLQS